MSFKHLRPDGFVFLSSRQFTILLAACVGVTVPLALFGQWQGWAAWQTALAAVAASGVICVRLLESFSRTSHISRIVEQRTRELRESQQRFEAFMKHLPGVAFMKDSQGRYVYRNETFQRLFGNGTGDGLGNTADDLWSPDVVRRLEENNRLVLREGVPREFIEELPTGGQAHHWMSIKFPVRIDEETEFLAGIAIDVTDRRQAELELAAAREKAEAASRTKSEFLANMSHEIRTPMTAILGFADVLLEKLGDSEAAETARTIQRNGKYLLHLLNDILDLSKIEAARLHLEQVACSPGRILREVAELMSVRAESKGLGLSIRYDGLVPQTIVSDPTRLRQALINLAGNAVKFTEHGSVEIVARLLPGTTRDDVPDDRVPIAPSLQFDVIDTGIGMSEEQMQRLFTPFSQGDASTSRRFGGTGLGLAISKRLAQMLGGDITVRSVAGEGSTFSLTVATGPLDGIALVAAPSEISRGRKSPPPASAKPRPTLRCRILLVEDGIDNQRLISLILRKAGAEVTLAENGQEALERAYLPASQATDPAVENAPRREAFDLILMDMQMPVMDGYAATRRLRADGYHGPIVALTAHVMHEDVENCLQAGCNDHLSKPIDREQLLHWIANHVPQATQFPQS